MAPYKRARWYDPTVGRWISEDPIEFNAGDVNLYRYVGNEATGATDPSGLEERRGQFPGKPKRTIGRDILQDLHREDAALRPIIEHQHNIRQQNKRDIGEASQRVMADLGGFGPLIDGSEAISGRNVLSSECEQLTTWQRIKSGAWALVGMLPFLGRSDDVARASRGGLNQLVHLTDDAGKFGIAKVGTINGSHGIFAVPAHVARESEALKVLRTGLPRGKTRNAVSIPDEALKWFERPVPVGPYSGWKFFGGVCYAPAGSLNMATEQLTRSGSLVGPKVIIYGPDGVFYIGVATTAGLYIYAQTGGGE